MPPDRNHPTRRRVLGLAAGLPLLALAPRTARRDDEAHAPKRRPNVLFVFSDSHRAMDTGCYGSESVATPRLDAFAAQGVRVATCISNTPVCRPYRASLMSGQYARHHGLLTNVSERNESVEGRQWQAGERALLGVAFRDAGYRCGYVGKWHLGEMALAPGDPRRLGFDDGWCTALKPVHDYKSWTYATGVDTHVSGEGSFRPAFERERVLGFIDEEDDRPWFAVLSWGPPHEPFTPPAAFVRKQPEVLPANVNTPEARAMARENLPGYRGLIEALDHEFGLLLEALGERGLAEDTLVVYTSDHGHQLGSHSLAGKEAPFDESTRVPLLLRWPGRLAAGRVHDGLVSAPDLFPTLAGLCGVTVPDGPVGADRSLELTGEGLHTGLQAAYLSAYDTSLVPWPGWRGVRTERHLYVCTQVGPWLLFDLAEDPFQLHNRVKTDEATRDRLHALTQERMALHGDGWEA